MDDEDLERLESQAWTSRPGFEWQSPVVRAGWFGRKILNQRADGSCVFLQADGLCRIHAEFGEAAKPWACRMYPFELIPFDDRVHVVVRRNCPQSAAGNGRTVLDHMSYVRQFVAKALPADRHAGPPPLVAGGHRSWKAAHWAVEQIERLMTDANVPLVRRFAHVIRFSSELQSCPAAKTCDDAIKKLLPGMVQVAGEELTNIFRQRVSPNAQTITLFRQTAAEYARWHPNFGDRPSWRERLRFLKAAFAFARGTGAVPIIHPDLPPATFAELDEPLGSLAPEVVQPIDEYFRTNVAAARYCGAAHFAWPVVDGVRGLALAYAVALWLLRWRSVRRAPTTADAVEVVRTIDRSHEYPLLAGGRHRRRVAWLSRSDELVKLLAWQAR